MNSNHPLFYMVDNMMKCTLTVKQLIMTQLMSSMLTRATLNELQVDSVQKELTKAISDLADRIIEKGV